MADAHADHKRHNEDAVANVCTVQRQAGCTGELTIYPCLAAQQHSGDVVSDYALVADFGSDGSTPQERADAAGFRGAVAETVAIHPVLAISDQWDRVSQPVAPRPIGAGHHAGLRLLPHSGSICT